MVSKERKQSIAEMYNLAEKFNTILTAVLDYAELALSEEDYKEMEYIAKMAKAVMEAYYKQQKAEIAKGVN